MEKFPWDDDAISKPARNVTNDLPRSLSASDLAALGLPVDDPFWLSPEAFDAHLAEVEGQQAAQVKTLGPNAPAAQIIRMASPCRAPLPSLDPRKKGPAMTELPEAVRRAVEIIATPHAPDDQAIGAAAYLLKWYQAEYHCLPTLKGIVLWWWKAARRLVDIRRLWADEIRALWRTDECQDALDPAYASVNAFYGHLARHAGERFSLVQKGDTSALDRRRSSSSVPVATENDEQPIKNSALAATPIVGETLQKLPKPDRLRDA